MIIIIITGWLRTKSTESIQYLKDISLVWFVFRPSSLTRSKSNKKNRNNKIDPNNELMMARMVIDNHIISYHIIYKCQYIIYQHEIKQK